MQQFIAEIATAVNAGKPASQEQEQREQQKQREQQIQRERQMQREQQIAQEQQRRMQEYQKQQALKRQLVQQQLQEQRRQQLAQQQAQERQRQLIQQQRQKVAVPYVVVVEGIEKGKSWNIPVNQTLKFGRSEAEANMRVRFPESVSRIHCMITYLAEYDRFCIRDISANGVYYKGQRLNKGIDYNVKPPARFIMSSNECVVELGVRYEYR